MELDMSRQFYDLYFISDNHDITVILKNGKKIRGVFIAVFKGDESIGEPFIKRWHIVEEKYKLSLGINAFGYLIGEYVNQEEIFQITAD